MDASNDGAESVYSLVPPARRTVDRSLRHMKFVLSPNMKETQCTFFTEFVMERGAVVIREEVAKRLIKEEEDENVAYVVCDEAEVEAGTEVVKKWVHEDTEEWMLPLVLVEGSIFSLKECAIIKGRGSRCNNVTLPLYRSNTYCGWKDGLGLSQKGIAQKLALMARTFDDWEEEVLKDNITTYAANLGPGVPFGVDPKDFPTIDPIPITITSRKRCDVAKELLTKFAGIFDDATVLHKFYLQVKDRVQGLTENKEQIAAMHDISSLTYSVSSNSYHLGLSCRFQLADLDNDADDNGISINNTGQDGTAGTDSEEITFITDPRPRPAGTIYDSDEEEEPWPYAGYGRAYLRPSGDSKFLRHPDEVVISTSPIRVMFDRWMPDSIGVVKEVNAPNGLGHFTRMGLLQALVDACAEVNPDLVKENMALNAVWLQDDGVYHQRIE